MNLFNYRADSRLAHTVYEHELIRYPGSSLLAFLGLCLDLKVAGG